MFLKKYTKQFIVKDPHFVLKILLALIRFLPSTCHMRNKRHAQHILFISGIKYLEVWKIVTELCVIFELVTVTHS